MNKIISIILIITIFVFSGFFEGASAAETKLLISPVEVQSGSEFSVPIKILNAEKVAGIKLVLEYDTKLLTYVKTEKSDKTSKLMHVVNDKKPGKLIIVMAGAKGVSGSDLEIMALSFKAIPNLKQKVQDKISILEVELVAEDLKAIKCDVIENQLTVIP